VDAAWVISSTSNSNGRTILLRVRDGEERFTTDLAYAGLGERRQQAADTNWLTVTCRMNSSPSTKMWDSTAVDRSVRRMNRESEKKSIGIPHLAKNERDVGHPSLVGGEKF
jgi:hypothetical protein